MMMNVISYFRVLLIRYFLELLPAGVHHAFSDVCFFFLNIVYLLFEFNFLFSPTFLPHFAADLYGEMNYLHAMESRFLFSAP